MVYGNIHSVETFGAVDGPGIRYVVFFQGCRMRCMYCHNPDTWDTYAGKRMTADALAADILSYKNFLSGGVTLSGGEPLLQPEFALELLHKCHENGFHTALDTAGSVELSVSRPVIDATDMLLLDIKSGDEELCKTITGRSDAFALANKTLEYCDYVGKPVWVRHVLVPGYTLSEERLTRLAEKLSRYSCISRVDLLPFHKMGEYKWNSADTAYKLYDTKPPSQEEIFAAEKIFKAYGFNQNK